MEILDRLIETLLRLEAFLLFERRPEFRKDCLRPLAITISNTGGENRLPQGSVLPIAGSPVSRLAVYLLAGVELPNQAAEHVSYGRDQPSDGVQG